MQLLVSVTSEAEARSAAAGGADIIDVKNPDQGSLGFAGWPTIHRVCEVAEEVGVPVSAAFGEVVDWRPGQLDGPDQAPSLPLNAQAVASPLRFGKLGLAGTCGQHADQQSWIDQWSNVRSLIPYAGQWVGVAYADFELVHCPHPADILRQTAQINGAAFLIDTSIKDGRSSFDHLTMTQLLELRATCRHQGLLFAFAGSLTEDRVDEIRTIDPDIVAVRGAACEKNDRRATVVTDRVVRLKEMVDQLNSAKAEL